MSRRSPALTSIRNSHIQQRFRQLRKKHPQWMSTAIIDTVAAEFYLSPVTVAKVLKAAAVDVPDASTIARQRQLPQQPVVFQMAV